MNQCERCGRRLIQPEGARSAEILLVGDAPTQVDVSEGQLWTGPGGDILRTELRRAGIHPKMYRITNMWLHAKYSDCEAHMDELLEEMNGRKAILLMGADTTKYFVGKNVSDVSGLRVDETEHAKEMLPRGPIVYAIFNPALALHDKMGEIRFGMEKFGEAIKEI